MADRNYGSSFNQQHASPSFNYVWDSSAVINDAAGNPITGAWTPATPSAGGGGGGSTDMAATNTILTSGANYLKPASVSCSQVYTGSFGVAAAREINSVFGYNSGNAQFLRVYDGTGTNGTLIAAVAISQQNNFSIDLNTHGATLSAGIFVAFSSSPVSQSASGPDGIITIIWK